MNIAIPAPSYLLSDKSISSEGQAVLEICSRLAAMGHRIYIAGPEVSLSSSIENVSISQLGPPGIMPLTSPAREISKWWIFSVRARFWLKALLKREDIDIVHHFFPSTPGDFSLLADLHNTFIFGPEPLPPTGLAPEEFVRGTERRITATGPIHSAYMPLRNELYRRTIRRAKRILIQVPAVAGYVNRADASAASRVEIVPLGVDTKKFFPAGEEEEEGCILFVGGLTRIKGLEYLIAAMPSVLKTIPNAKLLVVGEGPDRAYFEKITRLCGCENHVAFLGFIPQADINRIYSKCAVFCLPSLAEAFSLVILEAMSSAKPIVATRVGGIPSLAQDCAILIAPRSPSQIASALVRLLENKELRVALAKNSRQRALSQFDWNIIVDHIEAIYKSCLRD